MRWENPALFSVLRDLSLLQRAVPFLEIYSLPAVNAAWVNGEHRLWFSRDIWVFLVLLEHFNLFLMEG